MKKQTKDALVWALCTILTTVWIFQGLPALLNGSDLSIVLGLLFTAFVAIGLMPHIVTKFDSFKNTVKGRSTKNKNQ